ncbi:MAG: hypothetical protein V7L20_31530 [Nostoc sp.]|uniref:hypothetical protein n=1 Tax=Nostoc sp. TaxID=1180 RepID=UPI002FF50230
MAGATVNRVYGGKSQSLADYLRVHLNQLQAEDYFALLAYIERNEFHQEQLQAIRSKIRDAKQVPTCLGFSLCFLHSTGQASKVGQIAVYFCKSPVMIPLTSPFLNRNTPLE